MSFSITKFTESNFFSLFFISALTSALFYTGNNTWLFSIGYIFIVFCITLVLKQRFYNSIDIPINGILISAFLLLIWFSISITLSQIKYLSLYNLFWVGSLLVVFLIFTFNQNKDQIWNIIYPSILMLVFIWAIYALVQYYYLHEPSNATFLNRNSLAALINLALIPASGYFLLNEKERPWKVLSNKKLGFILATLFLTIFIITSRGASLSLALGFFILFILLHKLVEKIQLLLLTVILVISFLCATLSQYFIADLPSGFAERMATIKDSSQAGNSRFIIWGSLLPLFSDMPWYGLGLGSLWVYWPPYRPANDSSAGFFAHNDYIQITLEAGYPGILLLILLFVFILLNFIRTLKNSAKINNVSSIYRVELVSLFSALLTFAAHSLFTYNFYVFPLLIIAGIYLGRFNQLSSVTSSRLKTFPSLKIYFKPALYVFSVTGLIFILCSYFFGLSISNYYNSEAKKLMSEKKFQASNELFLKAQTLAPLMDNPFFSHADLLRRAADRLNSVNKLKDANTLIKLAHLNLDKAEKLNPFRPQTHHIRGLIFLKDQPKKAKTEFRKALKLDPRFLFSRIQLAKIHKKEHQLKQAIEVLYQGIEYNYPVNKLMLEYMQYFAKLSREAGAEGFAKHLEENIKKFISQNSKKSSL